MVQPRFIALMIPTAVLYTEKQDFQCAALQGWE